MYSSKIHAIEQEGC